MRKAVIACVVFMVVLSLALLCACEKTPDLSSEQGKEAIETSPESGIEGSKNDPSDDSSENEAPNASENPNEEPSEGSDGSEDPALDSATEEIEDPNAYGEKAAAILETWESNYTAGDFGMRSKSDPFVEIEVASYGRIRLELYPDIAPISVENFLRYVREGFYTDVIFHRVIKDFMIQTGGFVETEFVQGTFGWYKSPTHPSIKGEFEANGVENALLHTEGVLSMARGEDSDSASSQFFICTADAYWLNGAYAAFGKVIDAESMAVVRAIENVPTTTTYLVYGQQGVRSESVPYPEFPTILSARVVWIDGSVHS